MKQMKTISANTVISTRKREDTYAKDSLKDAFSLCQTFHLTAGHRQGARAPANITQLIAYSIMDIDSLPHIIMIIAALVLILIVFAKVMNIDVLGNLSSMIISLSRNIFSSIAF